jgi:hypothetical protein
MDRGGVLLLALVLAACGGKAAPATTPTPSEDEPRPIRTGPDDSDDDEDADPNMQVDGLKGSIDQADIQPVIERAWDQVQACYTDHGGKKQRYLGGRLELAFRIHRDGTVKRVAVNGGSDLGAWPIEACVLEVARALTFPKPRGGEAEFSFPIDFPGRGRVDELDEASAREQLGKQLGKLHECEQDDGAPMPRQVRVTFYIVPGGKVASVGFSAVAGDEQPLPAAFAECAQERALKWKVKDPRGVVHKAQVVWSR